MDDVILPKISFIIPLEIFISESIDLSFEMNFV